MANNNSLLVRIIFLLAAIITVVFAKGGAKKQCDGKMIPRVPNSKQEFPGSMLTSTFAPGHTIKVECGNGYKPFGKGDIQCDKNGKWEVLTTCEKEIPNVDWKNYNNKPKAPVFSCSAYDLPKVENGHFVAPSIELFAPGKGVVVVCNTGYSPVGEGGIKCAQQGGKWEILTKCQKDQIKPPPKEEARISPDWCAVADLPKIENGHVIIPRPIHFAPGTVGRVKCNTGYIPVGEGGVRCALKGGKWEILTKCQKELKSTESPKTEVQCSQRPVIPNARVPSDRARKSYPVGSVRKVKCLEGFTATGDGTIRCGEDGLWKIQTSCEAYAQEMLFAAIHASDLDGMRLMFERGVVSANGRRKDGTTPLIYAISQRKFDAARLLLNQSAEVDLQLLNNGQTALMVAVHKNLPEIFDHLQDFSVVADLDIQDRRGYTVLMHAAKHGRSNIARVLIENGASLEKKSKHFKDTALTLAARKGHLETVQLLLDAGADVNVKRGGTGMSPLHLAVWANQSAVVDTLLNAGANVDAKDDVSKFTPLMYAAYFDLPAIGSALMHAGADYAYQAPLVNVTAMTLARNRKLWRTFDNLAYEITTRPANFAGEASSMLRCDCKSSQLRDRVCKPNAGVYVYTCDKTTKRLCSCSAGIDHAKNCINEKKADFPCDFA